MTQLGNIKKEINKKRSKEKKKKRKKTKGKQNLVRIKEAMKEMKGN